MTQPTPPEQRPLLHFTHVDHLPAILDAGCVLADALVGRRLTAEVGDRSIKARRRLVDVDAGPGGHASDYVPFYFAPRSPMLYRIALGGVEQYSDGQDPLVYLVTTIGCVVDAGLPWVFTDGNCAASWVDYYDDLSELDHVVDWTLMRATMWSNTADDPNRAARRAAEFLVHERLPIGLVRQFVTRTQDTRVEVEALLGEADLRIPVVVRPAWYYSGSRFRVGV